MGFTNRCKSLLVLALDFTCWCTIVMHDATKETNLLMLIQDRLQMFGQLAETRIIFVCLSAHILVYSCKGIWSDDNEFGADLWWWRWCQKRIWELLSELVVRLLLPFHEHLPLWKHGKRNENFSKLFFRNLVKSILGTYCVYFRHCLFGAGKGCQRLPWWFVHFLAQIGNVKNKQGSVALHKPQNCLMYIWCMCSLLEECRPYVLVSNGMASIRKEN